MGWWGAAWSETKTEQVSIGCQIEVKAKLRGLRRENRGDRGGSLTKLPDCYVPTEGAQVSGLPVWVAIWKQQSHISE